MTLLARLVAKEEGYGIPGAVHTTHNNPGDLRHSPHSEHLGDPDAIGQIGSVDEGWADLERQLELYAKRGMTLREAIYAFAPQIENDTERYLQFVCAGLNMPPSALVSEALKIP